MNGRASFGDQSWQGIEQCCGAIISPIRTAQAKGRHDQRDDGIHGGGRRNVADLLPADESGAEPPSAARERRQRRFQHQLWLQ